MDLNSIVKVLNKEHQRATYGAIAGILGKQPRSLMTSCNHGPFYSWVVAKRNQEPYWLPTRCKAFKAGTHDEKYLKTLRNSASG